MPGLFSVPPQATPGRWTERKSHSPGTAAHRWTEPPRVQAVPYTHAHSRHRGRTEPRNRARVQGHRQARKSRQQSHRGRTDGKPQSRPQHSENRKPPETALFAPINHATPPGVFLYYPGHKTPHRGAQSRHRGQAGTGYSRPGNAAALAPVYSVTLK